MHFNIFPGQHNHQTSISLNQCGQLYRVGWRAHSLIHQLSINYGTFCNIPLQIIQNLLQVYSKKDTSCIIGKWWSNSIFIKKGESFTTVPMTLSITCT
jgi:hypothetical protein